MKRFTSIFGLLFVTVLLTTGAHAQWAEQVIKVDVPFAFNVGDQTFPAGSYSLVRNGPSVIALRDSRRNILATAITGAVQATAAPATPKLEFYVEDGRHILARIWRRDDTFGNELYRHRTRIAVAQRKTAPVQTAAEGSQP